MGKSACARARIVYVGRKESESESEKGECNNWGAAPGSDHLDWMTGRTGWRIKIRRAKSGEKPVSEVEE